MLIPAFGITVVAIVGSLFFPPTVTVIPSVVLLSESVVPGVVVLFELFELSGFSVSVGFCSSSFSTIIVAVPVLLPSNVVAVIVASPSFTPVTTPSSFIVAIDSSLELHFTFLFVAFSGVTVAINVVLFPTFTF